MNMKKVAIAVMLLAASAFAGPIVSVGPAEIQSGETVTLKLDSMTGGAVAQLGIYAYADKAGVVTVLGATNLHPQVDGPNIDPTGWVLGDAFGTTGSMGVLAKNVFTGATLTGDVMSITLSSTEFPITVYFGGDYVMTGGETGFWGVAEPVSVTITPEPASMILLAAGAAFFARRRRA